MRYAVGSTDYSNGLQILKIEEETEDSASYLIKYLDVNECKFYSKCIDWVSITI